MVIVGTHYPIVISANLIDDILYLLFAMGEAAMIAAIKNKMAETA